MRMVQKKEWSSAIVFFLFQIWMKTFRSEWFKCQIVGSYTHNLNKWKPNHLSTRLKKIEFWMFPVIKCLVFWSLLYVNNPGWDWPTAWPLLKFCNMYSLFQWQTRQMLLVNYSWKTWSILTSVCYFTCSVKALYLLYLVPWIPFDLYKSIIMTSVSKVPGEYF